MHSILHIILNTSTELMSAVELMSGAKSRKWVHQKPTNQPSGKQYSASSERHHERTTLPLPKTKIKKARYGLNTLIFLFFLHFSQRELFVLSLFQLIGLATVCGVEWNFKT